MSTGQQVTIHPDEVAKTIRRPLSKSVDLDWVERASAKYAALPRGMPTQLAKALGMDKGAFSKACCHGTNVDHRNVFAISRALRIAPPRCVLDDAQYELLSQLEAFREEIGERYDHDSESIDDASEGLIRKFRRAIGEILGRGPSPAA